MQTARTVTAEGGSAVPLRVDHITGGTAGSISTLYCTDTEGTELQLTIRGISATNLPLETDEWYCFDGVVQSTSLGAQLVFPSEGGTIEPLDTPDRQPSPPVDDDDEPWLLQMGATDERIAVTVSPRPTHAPEKINVESPETFEIGAVCFAHCDRSCDATVYHREEPDRRDEQLLLQHVVEDLSSAEGATLVTHTNDPSPLKLLYQRLERASGGDIVPTEAEQVLTRCFHATTSGVAVRAETDTLSEAARQLDIGADPVSLDAYDIGIDPQDWREDWNLNSVPLSDVSDGRMIDRDYTTLVERYLTGGTESLDVAELARCLKSYVSADLDLLCDLVTHGTMDQLGCPRLQDRFF